MKKALFIAPVGSACLNNNALSQQGRFFIRLRRIPPVRVDARPPHPYGRYGGWKCVNCARIIHKLKYYCFGGFRRWRITLRSLGVGGYFMEVPPVRVGLHFSALSSQVGVE